MSSLKLPEIAAAPDSTNEIEALSNTGEHPPIRVVIAMSSNLERIAWGIIVEGQSDMRLVAQTASSDEALTILKTHETDVTLIDEDMLNASHYRALREYSSQPSSSRFILVAPHELDYSMGQSRFSFAHAHMLKGFSAAEFLEVIRTTADEPGS